MKTLVAVAVFALFAIPTVKAQTTQTNCNLYGNTANCTSTTTPTYGPDPAAMAQAGQNMGAAMGNLAAVMRAKKAASERAEVNIVYCQQNSEGSITTKDGTKSCSEAAAREVAFCTIKPKDKLCKFFAQHRAVKPLNVEQSWDQAVQEFLHSPAGSDWPGGDKNRDMMGQELQALNLVDAKDKVAALAQAYASMKSKGIVVPYEPPSAASATTEDVKGAR
jgi:hypothetical protein